MKKESTLNTEKYRQYPLPDKYSNSYYSEGRTTDDRSELLNEIRKITRYGMICGIRM